MSISPMSTLLGSSSIIVGRFRFKSFVPEGGTESWEQSISISAEAEVGGIVWISTEEETKEALVISEAEEELRFESGAFGVGLEERGCPC